MAPDPTIIALAKLIGMPKTEAARMQRAAERRRMTSATLARKAIADAVAETNDPPRRNGHAAIKVAPLTARQRAAFRKAAGVAKGLPRDLSTNPKHMEGFGRD